MDGDPEGLEAFLARVARRLVERLLADPRIPAWGALGELGPASADRYEQLAKIKMTVQVQKALDKHLGDLIRYGTDPREALLNEVLSDGPATAKRATWKQIGDALGVSAQAAHHKYGHGRGGR